MVLVSVVSRNHPGLRPREREEFVNGLVVEGDPAASQDEAENASLTARAAWTLPVKPPRLRIKTFLTGPPSAPPQALGTYALSAGDYFPGDRTRYAGLVEGLSSHDTFLVIGDFDSYWSTPRNLDALWRNRDAW